jgi:D-serine deaminase-like pyridoxal phosphate-dependent protein
VPHVQFRARRRRHHFRHRLHRRIDSVDPSGDLDLVQHHLARGAPRDAGVPQEQPRFTDIVGSASVEPIPAATPALVIDEAVLDANIARAAAFAARAGLALRPHVKTHKSIEIARRQRAAGASGITVATLSEAEVFAGAGFTDIFVAYPLWLDEFRTASLARVLERSSVLIGVDSVVGIEKLAGTGLAATGRLAVLVEVDSGHHRSGISAVEAGPLAAAARDTGLDVAGVFTFPGHSYSPETRHGAADDEQRALASAVASLDEQGIAARIVSGGSTPSLEFASSTVLTEVRPGVYVFGDAQQWELGTTAPVDIALTALATVVSRSPGHLILDTGSKVLGADRGTYSSGFGRLLDHTDARITALSEHHATVVGIDLPLGTRVRVVPNHVCAAVNLADEYLIDIRRTEGVPPTIWPVDARGRNR